MHCNLLIAVALKAEGSAMPLKSMFLCLITHMQFRKSWDNQVKAVKEHCFRMQFITVITQTCLICHLSSLAPYPQLTSPTRFSQGGWAGAASTKPSLAPSLIPHVVT